MITNRLTKTEQMIYDCVVNEALKDQAIADRLNFSLHTVERNLEKIYLKCGVRTKCELIVLHYSTLKNNVTLNK